MPAEIFLQQTATHAALIRKREELAAVRLIVAGTTADLNRYRTELKVFEDRYFCEAGVLYAELDTLEARIAEREVDLYDSDAARRRAHEARQKAEESRDAVFDHTADAAEFDPPASLRTLFRDVAKRIHPDFARDDNEAQYFTLLMARANQAYRRGDAETLQRLLEDHRETSVFEGNEGVAAELTRVTRQMQHARRDLAAVESEQQALASGEIAQLHMDVQAAALERRDLVAELAAGLREQIADAVRRLELIDRQIKAHGR